jgi:hypothetical protein
MHFNRMAFDHLSAGEERGGGGASIDIREESDAGAGDAGFVSLATGSGAAAAAHGGREQSDTMHFNRMAFGHLSAGDLEGGGGGASIVTAQFIFLNFQILGDSH